MEEKINIGFGITMGIVRGESGARVSLDNSVTGYTRVITPLGDYSI